MADLVPRRDGPLQVGGTLRRPADDAFDLVAALGIYHCAGSGKEWSRAMANVVLEHPVEGDLVLDLLTDRLVGGVEFLDSLGP